MTKAALAVAAHHAGERGAVGGHDELADSLDGASDPELQAWALALRGQRHFAAPAGIFPVDADRVRGDLRRGGAPIHPVLALACAHGARDAVLRFDRPALAVWVETSRRLRLAPGSPSALRRRVIEAWQSWVGADGLDHLPALTDIADRARAAGDAALTIEATALRGLLEAESDDLDAALRTARRASRMARTEALPQPQYLANLVLARLRRLTGRTHLSVYILNALLRVAPRPWWGWMHWERSLAGGTGDVPSEAVLASRVRAWVDAAAEGERARMTAAAEATRASVQSAPQHRELDALAALLDLRAPVPSALRPWIRGAEQSEGPLGLLGLGTGPSPKDAEPVWVLAHAGGARRLLGVGLAALDGVEVLSSGKRRKARTDSAIAALLLGGEEEEERFFAAIYGFPYQASAHRGARDMLYHRIRERLKPHAELQRTDGSLRIVLNTPIAVPDPRCAPPAENAILVVLAHLGTATARDAAEALGLPLRTAQHALRALAEEGVCVAEKVGREVRYHVQDTTFVEPTTVSARF